MSMSMSMAMAGRRCEGVGLEVIVVGGSIAGLCCAHSILHHAAASTAVSVTVTVLERSRSFTTAAAGGAGLGLDPVSCNSALQRWLGGGILHHSLPLSSEENRVINIHDHGETHETDHVANSSIRDEEYGHRAAHWGDLHYLLYHALPEGTVRWGHEVLSFQQKITGAGRHRVYVTVRSSKTCEDNSSSEYIQEIEGDLLIAADGAMSQVRQTFLPLEKRRYCGYCAWRGVLDASTEEGTKIKAALRKVYPDLGHCLYFHINVAENTHAVLYELTRERLNWLWYVNQPEPNLKGLSVTTKADDESISRMHEEASRVWPRELAVLMQATPLPFINAIYDQDPLKEIVWGHVALVGDAAHPISPHGVRSTNMSIMDADVLGRCVVRWGSSQVEDALCEYQSIRSAVTAHEVLFSRHLGRVKQGLSAELHNAQNVPGEFLLQRSIHKFEDHQHIL